MKFERIDGVQYIILEDKEKVCVTTNYEYSEGDGQKIKIENGDNGLTISGDSSVISSIRGDGILEKVYIPPVLTSEEIIDKCDKWLDMFKRVHDVFAESVKTQEYREQSILMELCFSNFFSLNDKNVNGKSIDLDLKQYGNIIKEGVTLSIDDENEDVFKYIYASVLDYYISRNLEGEEIDLMNFNGSLYSRIEDGPSSSVPMIASLSTLTQVSDYYRIFATIAGNHNIGETSDQLIANLRNRIKAQQMGDRMDLNINHSARQCEYVLKKSFKQGRQQQ